MNALLKDSRALGAIGAVVLVLILSIAGAAIAWSALDGKSLELEARQMELQVLVRRASVTRPDRPAAPVLKADPFLEGATFTLAANALQRRVVAMIEATGGTLSTVGIDLPNTGNDATRVVVQANAEMTVEALQQTLYRLESEAPFAFVEALAVERRAATGRDAEPATVSPRLRVELRVAGYFRRAER